MRVQSAIDSSGRSLVPLGSQLHQVFCIDSGGGILLGSCFGGQGNPSAAFRSFILHINSRLYKLEPLMGRVLLALKALFLLF